MKTYSIVLLCCGVLLSGCNTMKGLGKDMMKVGESLSRTAEKVQINHINQRNQQQQTAPNQNQVIYSQHPTYTAPSYPQQNAPQQQGYPSYQ